MSTDKKGKPAEYFSKLNYSLANEDTTLELQMVKALKPRNTLSVCGSGGRSLPLLVGTQNRLVCCDLSDNQLWLAAHRAETIKQLSFREFCMYWGFPPFETTENKAARKDIFKALHLHPDSREYFTHLYEELGWQGLLYEGKWEKTFTGVPKFLRKFLGDRYDHVFKFTNLDEQKEFFDRELTRLSWVFIPRMVLRAFGNAAFFNAFLYKGHFVKKNVPETHYEYYREAYRRLFYLGLTRENFFLQLTFLGKIAYPEGNTVEGQPDTYQAMKEIISHREVVYAKGDIVSTGERAMEMYGEKFDFVSLSDVPSYFNAETDQNYLQRLKAGLNLGAHCVVRCYLRVPENTDLTGFQDVTPEFQTLVDTEKTQIYRTFIYRFVGNE